MVPQVAALANRPLRGRKSWQSATQQSAFLEGGERQPTRPPTLTLTVVAVWDSDQCTSTPSLTSLLVPFLSGDWKTFGWTPLCGLGCHVRPSSDPAGMPISVTFSITVICSVGYRQNASPYTFTANKQASAWILYRRFRLLTPPQLIEKQGTLAWGWKLKKIPQSRWEKSYFFVLLNDRRSKQKALPLVEYLELGHENTTHF